MNGEVVVAVRLYDSDIKNKFIKIYFVNGTNIIDELTAAKMGIAELLHIDYDRVHGLTTLFYKLSSPSIAILLLELHPTGTYHLILYGPSELILQDFEKEELLTELQKKSEKLRKLLQSSTDPSSSPSSSRSN
jgi:hypothetical protein